MVDKGISRKGISSMKKTTFDYDQYLYERIYEFLDSADWVLNGRQEMPKPFPEDKRDKLIQKGREVFYKEEN